MVDHYLPWLCRAFNFDFDNMLLNAGKAASEGIRYQTFEDFRNSNRPQRKGESVLATKEGEENEHHNDNVLATIAAVPRTSMQPTGSAGGEAQTRISKRGAADVLEVSLRIWRKHGKGTTLLVKDIRECWGDSVEVMRELSRIWRICLNSYPNKLNFASVNFGSDPCMTVTM